MVASLLNLSPEETKHLKDQLQKHNKTATGASYYGMDAGKLKFWKNIPGYGAQQPPSPQHGQQPDLPPKRT